MWLDSPKSVQFSDRYLFMAMASTEHLKGDVSVVADRHKDFIQFVIVLPSSRREICKGSPVSCL